MSNDGNNPGQDGLKPLSIMSNPSAPDKVRVASAADAQVAPPFAEDGASAGPRPPSRLPPGWEVLKGHTNAVSQQRLAQLEEDGDRMVQKLAQLSQHEIQLMMEIMSPRPAQQDGARVVPQHVMEQKIESVGKLVHTFRLSVCVLVFGPGSMGTIHKTTQMDGYASQLVNFLSSQSRSTDMICHLDNYCVAMALFNQPLYGALRLAERVLKDWKNHAPYASRLTRVVAGISNMLDTPVPARQLLQQAEQARRFCIYDPRQDIRVQEPVTVMEARPERFSRFQRQFQDLTRHISRVVPSIYPLLERMERDHAQFGLDPTERVAISAVLLARDMGLSETEQGDIAIAALTRDLGMLRMPPAFYLQVELPEHLRSLLHFHPSQSVELLKNIVLPSQVPEIILNHHERFDGTGYPNQLKGELLPLPAQILSAADAMVAMSRRRNHRQPLPVGQILQVMKSLAGTQFEPTIVSKALRLDSLHEELETSYTDETARA